MVDLTRYRPLPRRRGGLIPDGWERYHARAVAGSRTAEVELWTGPQSGEPEWLFDPVKKTETRNRGRRLYPDCTIWARIQRLVSEDGATAGEQAVTARRYLIALDREVSDGLNPNALVHVICSGDDYLDDRWLSVVDIQGGSLRFERHLVALDHLD